MGVSSLATDGRGLTVDLSAKGLQKLEPDWPCNAETHTLILDQNHIIKLEHLEKSHQLQQLSVAGNRLVRMMGVSRLTELRVLNLPNNSIGYIEGLRDLVHLEWLNLAGNNIKVMDQLSGCVALQHLDLSDNNISQIGDLAMLFALKTLLLHGNIITTLRSVPAHLPPSLSILSLAENEIRDLNEVSYLAPLPALEQLSIMSNPCVMATPSPPGFDYRPYIVSWCLSLKVLDGYVVSQKEGLKAEWLYSQGKGRLFRPGQHVQLIQYLASVCPLTSASSLQSAEDAKLEKILSKQRLHQRQLLQQSQTASQTLARPTHLDVEQHLPAPGPSPAPLEGSAEPPVQVNTWLVGDHSYSAAPPSCSSTGDALYLEDVQTDEDKLSFSLLSSESTFLYPCNPGVASSSSPDCVACSHSDDEPDEPNSLVPETPEGAGPGDGLEVYAQVDGEVVLGACSDCTAVETQVQTKWQEGPAQTEQAAKRIQAWWRGIWTRQRHPMAREVRSEIRLRRMQEHIVFLSAELQSVQKQLEEERLQRLVQEEAVKYLWKQLQSVMESQRSVEQQLAAVSRNDLQLPHLAPLRPLSVCATSAAPACSQLSFPDSGFQSSGEPLGAAESSVSSDTGGSVETVRALAEGLSRYEDQDCSLLQQYLCSVQQQEEEEEEGVDGSKPPMSPAAWPQPDSPCREEATGQQGVLKVASPCP
ncbi:centrosomal protein of 97 kDa [Arapaima gigas]